MAATIILEVKAKPGGGDELVALFKNILPDTRSYDGCISVDVYRNQDEPEVITLVEQWEARPKYETYLGWRQESGALDALGAMLAAPPSIRFFDNTGV